MKGTRPLMGPALTYDLCGQNVKVKIQTATVHHPRLHSGVLPRPKRRGFDFKILTALKGWVGLAP